MYGDCNVVTDIMQNVTNLTFLYIMVYHDGLNANYQLEISWDRYDK